MHNDILMMKTLYSIGGNKNVNNKELRLKRVKQLCVVFIELMTSIGTFCALH